MERGYFFCGDLLGFGKITKNLKVDELDEKINSWVSIVELSAQNNDIKNFQLISDTVFAAVGENTNELKKLVNFSRELLNNGILKSLLIRGAIVHGSFTFGEKLVYGDAVINAHLLEQQQNWIGIVIDSAISLSAQDYVNLDLICYPAPMANNVIKGYHALCWNIPQLESLSMLSTGGGLTLKGEPLNWNWGSKIQNTILFNLYVKAIKENGYARHEFKGLLPIHLFDIMLHNPIN